ncbi:hypothetical protein L218DRAFT_949626 [Marasmius fiardii PR-910]|nr:hypothetical protein L218DRAFT_949626 [Marasmius fiardii PR-910]
MYTQMTCTIGYCKPKVTCSKMSIDLASEQRSFLKIVDSAVVPVPLHQTHRTQGGLLRCQIKVEKGVTDSEESNTVSNIGGGGVEGLEARNKDGLGELSDLSDEELCPNTIGKGKALLKKAQGWGAKTELKSMGMRDFGFTVQHRYYIYEKIMY